MRFGKNVKNFCGNDSTLWIIDGWEEDGGGGENTKYLCRSGEMFTTRGTLPISISSKDFLANRRN